MAQCQIFRWRRRPRPRTLTQVSQHSGEPVPDEHPAWLLWLSVAGWWLQKLSVCVLWGEESCCCCARRLSGKEIGLGDMYYIDFARLMHLCAISSTSSMSSCKKKTNSKTNNGGGSSRGTSGDNNSFDLLEINSTAASLPDWNLDTHTTGWTLRTALPAARARSRMSVAHIFGPLFG